MLILRIDEFPSPLVVMLSFSALFSAKKMVTIDFLYFFLS